MLPYVIFHGSPCFLAGFGVICCHIFVESEGILWIESI